MNYFLRTTITVLLLLTVCHGQIKLDSSHLPIISIETGGLTIKDDPRITAHMKVIHHPDKAYNHISDTPNEYNGLIRIEIRGSSSQDVFPKNPYGLETVTLTGENNNVSILGLPQENDWILYAPYSDKSLIRNALAYKIARSMGRWASKTRFCELVINGEYRGVYVFMEKIKRDKNRVDIGEMGPDDIVGDALTGGYIFKLDKSTGSGGAGWTGYFRDFYQYEYPHARDIRSAQAQYIEEYVREFEMALASPAFRDRDLGYLRFIDRASFIDFLLVNELAKNVDGYRLSTFMYKDRDSRGGKLHMGPVWDFNFTFGNVNYCTGSERSGWVLNFNQFCPRDFWKINAWWDRLLTDKDFVDELIARWVSLREEQLHVSVLHAYIDSMAAEIGDAADRNFQLWDVLGKGVWPNVFIGDSWEEEIDYLKNWIEGRLSWMDRNMANIGLQVKGTSSGEFLNVAPNPFTEQISVRCRLRTSGIFSFEVRRLDGQLLNTIQKEITPEFDQELKWDGIDAKGNLLPAGIYIYTVKVNETIRKTGKISRY